MTPTKPTTGAEADKAIAAQLPFLSVANRTASAIQEAIGGREMETEGDGSPEEMQDAYDHNELVVREHEKIEALVDAACRAAVAEAVKPLVEALEKLDLHLTVLLPMAKGYASANPVGNNWAMIEEATADLLRIRQHAQPPASGAGESSHVAQAVAAETAELKKALEEIHGLSQQPYNYALRMGTIARSALSASPAEKEGM